MAVAKISLMKVLLGFLDNVVWNFWPMHVEVDGEDIQVVLQKVFDDGATIRRLLFSLQRSELLMSIRIIPLSITSTFREIFCGIKIRRKISCAVVRVEMNRDDDVAVFILFNMKYFTKVNVLLPSSCLFDSKDDELGLLEFFKGRG